MSLPVPTYYAALAALRARMLIDEGLSSDEASVGSGGAAGPSEGAGGPGPSTAPPTTQIKLAVSIKSKMFYV